MAPPKEEVHGNHGTRYFVVRSFNIKNVAVSVEHSCWATTERNQRYFRNAYNHSPHVVILWNFPKERVFQGYARMSSLPSRDHPDPFDDGTVRKVWDQVFDVDWMALTNLEYKHCSHMINPRSNEPVIHTRDGHEIPADLGRQICKLIDDQVSSQNSGAQPANAMGGARPANAMGGAAGAASAPAPAAQPDTSSSLPKHIQFPDFTKMSYEQYCEWHNYVKSHGGPMPYLPNVSEEGSSSGSDDEGDVDLTESETEGAKKTPVQGKDDAKKVEEGRSGSLKRGRDEDQGREAKRRREDRANGGTVVSQPSDWKGPTKHNEKEWYARCEWSHEGNGVILRMPDTGFPNAGEVGKWCRFLCDKGLPQFMRQGVSEWPPIYVLDLSKNGMTDEACQELVKAMRGMRLKVQRLIMSRNNIGPAGLQHLLHYIWDCPEPVRELVLSDNAINDQAFVDFVECLYQHPSYPARTHEGEPLYLVMKLDGNSIANTKQAVIDAGRKGPQGAISLVTAEHPPRCGGRERAAVHLPFFSKQKKD